MQPYSYEFVFAFNLRWEGKGADEIGYDDLSNKVRVRISSKYYRPAEVVSFKICFTFLPKFVLSKRLF